MALKLTGRDRWIAAVLPCVLVLAVYAVRRGYPTTVAVEKLSQELAMQEPAEMRQARAAQLRSEAQRLRGEREKAEALNSGENATVSLGRRRVGTLRRIARICEDSGVVLLAAEPAKENDFVLSAKSALAKQLDKAGWAEAQWWQLRLGGSYPALRRVMETMTDESMPAMVTRLEMKLPPDGGQNAQWVLGIWM